MKEIDWDQVESGKLEPGWWELEIVGVAESESSTGNDCLDVNFKEVNGEGRHFERFPLVPQALFKLHKLAQCCGLTVSGKISTSDLKQDLIGSVVKANIVHETWEGEERPKAKTFSPVK